MSYLITSYISNVNVNSYGTSDLQCQSFNVPVSGRTLDSVDFQLKWQGSAVTGTAQAYVYAHSGVFGTSSVGTGSPIATSDTVDISILTSNFSAIKFTFSGANKIALSNGTNYVIGFYPNSVSGGLLISGSNNLSGTASGNMCIFDLVGSAGWTAYSARDLSFAVYADSVPPTVTTQAVSSVAATTATGNGNITAIGYAAPDKRGIVYSTSSHADPGDVAPASSSYSGVVTETGSFSTGAFTESITGLTSRTTYYARAYAHNSDGYSYGGEVSFTTAGFTNPGNVYASDNTYATLAATSGILTVEVSKDAGANWSVGKTITFTGSDSLQTCGTGSTELWGTSWTRADMVDANFRIRLSQGSISQVYKTFGFATGTDILTGLEVAIEGNYTSPTMSLDLLKVKIYYGTSVLPVQAGSQAFASNGRKNGEGAGVGTGVLVFYDGTAWRACDTGATASA